jgi:hypothetical protein
MVEYRNLNAGAMIKSAAPQGRTHTLELYDEVYIEQRRIIKAYAFAAWRRASPP